MIDVLSFANMGSKRNGMDQPAATGCFTAQKMMLASFGERPFHGGKLCSAAR
jgi:hypothetical protein